MARRMEERDSCWAGPEELPGGEDGCPCREVVSCEAGEVEPIGHVHSLSDQRVATPVDATSGGRRAGSFQEAEGVNGQIVIPLTNRIVTQREPPATPRLRNGNRLRFRKYETVAPAGVSGSCNLHSLSSEFDTSRSTSCLTVHLRTRSNFPCSLSAAVPFRTGTSRLTPCIRARII